MLDVGSQLIGKLVRPLFGAQTGQLAIRAFWSQRGDFNPAKTTSVSLTEVGNLMGMLADAGRVSAEASCPGSRHRVGRFPSPQHCQSNNSDGGETA
jgi:hypothetical protein